MKQKFLKLALATIIVLALNAFLEINLLSYFYRGIPLPYDFTSKPIGAVIFPLTFYHLLVIVLNTLALAYICEKIGFKVGIIPRNREGTIDTILLITFLFSGFMLWYQPLFLLPFILIGGYLVFVEMK
ncbi:MAG: hypothetical protein QXG01_06365 [Candidatus Bathyarchaeia archaeon]